MKLQSNATVLFQGDSITDAGRKRDFGGTQIPANDIHALGAGYVGRVASRLLAERPDLGLRIHNRGISGDRVTDLRARWQVDCLDIRPDVLSILIGVNDTWHGIASGTPVNGVGIEEFDRVLRDLVRATRRALPALRLIVCEPFTTEAGAVLRLNFHPDIDRRREVVRRIAADSEAILVPFQDLFDGLCRTAPPAYWAADGVHPTPAGHEMMARFWIETVCG